MTHSDLALSLARRSDALAIAKMSRVLIEYGLQWQWTAQRVEASIRAANVNVLVARLDTRIIGFAIMRYGDDDAHLDLLAVAPPYRRLGVAQQLLQWLEKCATVAGTFRITLEVRENNRDAQRFYERMGYQRLSVVPGYYQGTEAAVRMSRNLACEAPKQQDAEH
jgi:ribosomal-protein-alanine N-acetyltransferase